MYSLFTVTALAEGKPVAAYVLANDPDEAIAKASANLPDGSKVKHLIFVCEGRLTTLQRNGLLGVCSDEEKVMFLADTIFEIITKQNEMIEDLKNQLKQIAGGIKERFNLRQFTFAVAQPTGPYHTHEIFAKNGDHAQFLASNMAYEQYGEGCRILGMKEVL